MYDIPIVFITFNRPDVTRTMLDQILKINPAKLYFFNDGPRNETDQKNCFEIRKMASEIRMEGQLINRFETANLGCKMGESTAMSWLFENEEMGIILEDDTYPSLDFFDFARQMLLKYKDDERVFSISGSNLVDTWKPEQQDYHFCTFTGFWGWAGWRRSWKYYDVAMQKWNDPESRRLIQNLLPFPEYRKLRFSEFDSLVSGKMDTWDYQFSFAHFMHHGLNLAPARNLIRNLGFNRVDAAHTTHDSPFANMKWHPLPNPIRDNPWMIPDLEYDREVIKLAYPFLFENQAQTAPQTPSAPSVSLGSQAKKVVRKMVDTLTPDLNRHLGYLKNELWFKAETDKKHLEEKLNELKLQLGSLESKLTSHQKANHLQHTEFKVYSQWGDDGILQYLIQHLPITSNRFIEFGTEAYTEANTRFLLMHNNWSGLIIDGSENNMNLVKNSHLYWQYDLKAVASFITKDNINRLFTDNGFTGNIGLLSIDIDGNDYWVWKAIDVVVADVVVAEFNPVFGHERKITIPYKHNFQRTAAHHSNLYFGASLPAMVQLGDEKGYRFVGTNRAGNNAYFVRKTLIDNADRLFLSDEIPVSLGVYKESRDPTGKLTFLSGDERARAIRGLPVFDLEKGEIVAF